jgi:hypothetical protein
MPVAQTAAVSPIAQDAEAAAIDAARAKAEAVGRTSRTPQATLRGCRSQRCQSPSRPGRTRLGERASPAHRPSQHDPRSQISQRDRATACGWILSNRPGLLRLDARDSRAGPASSATRAMAVARS